MKAKVIETNKNYPETIIFKAKPEEKINFLPGQFASIKFLGKNRAYSICSSPDDDYLEFCIKGTGEISKKLYNLKVGDNIELDGPYGNFIFRNPEEKRLIFVSTGSGIAPIKPMIKKAIEENSKEITLYFGVKKRENIYYKDLFEQLEKDYKNFKFIPVFSREDEDFKGRKGHVQDIIKKEMKNFDNLQVYICGMPRMVKEVREFFFEKGLSEDDVKTEQY